MQHTCSLCRKEFKAKTKNRRYCSKDCFNARNGHLKNIECLVCGTGLITYPNWIKRGGGKFCSTKCGGIARDKKVERVCLECGVNFRLKPSKIIHNASNYCSVKCSQKGSIGKEKPSIQGEKHPFWRGGISGERYPIEFNDELKENVLNRDNYECKICNMLDEEHILIYGYHLNIHHIDYIKKNSYMDNLISLCHQCHGRTNYNREYWLDYFLTKKEK